MQGTTAQVTGSVENCPGLTRSAIALTGTAEVNSTGGFPSTGTIKIQNEYMTYTGLSASPAGFTGLTRAALSSSAAGHSVNRAVLIATTLNGAVTDAATTVTVAGAAKFLGRGAVVTSADGGGGTVQIASEQINYASSTATTFIGCERGANGTSAAAHSNGDPVFPVTNTCLVKSTGTVGTVGTVNYGQRVFLEGVKE